jgi:lipase chaperone LimK
MRKSVLVSGLNGQLGKALQEASPLFPDLKIDFLNRDQLDLSQIGIKGEEIAWQKELLETQLDNVEDDIEKYYENEDTIQSNKELENQIKQLETEKNKQNTLLIDGTRIETDITII